MISPEKAQEIRRLYFGEHWPKGTIATQLDVHPDVVNRVVGPLGPEPKARDPRPQLLDPYKAFIRETLNTYPRLTATRVFDMILSRGYAGSLRTVTRHISLVRPIPKSEAFVRIERLPGEQAQVDWGHVGKLKVRGGERALWVFVMVLAYSRAIFAELVFDLTVHSLVRSLARASTFFGGVTRQWLFDNPKTVVLERQGDLVRFNPGLLRLTSELHVQPRLCGVRKPHQKGRVERTIRYLKDRFFPARIIHSIAHGNTQLQGFLEDVAMARKHPEHDTRTVYDVFQEEKEQLLALPDPMPNVDQICPVMVDKTASIRFDKNRYSVPPEHVKSTLTLVASDQRIRLLEGQDCVAEHERCWGRNQTLEQPEHRRAILDSKPTARDGQGRRRLLAAAPRMEELLQHWLDDGRNLGSLVARALKLLELYGARIFGVAVDELLTKSSYDLGALAVICEQHARPKPKRLPIELSPHVPERDVPSHDLGGYDD
ncbi:MAG: IS21 family transposase [Myxococcota bacterium]